MVIAEMWVPYLIAANNTKIVLQHQILKFTNIPVFLIRYISIYKITHTSLSRHLKPIFPTFYIIYCISTKIVSI